MRDEDQQPLSSPEDLAAALEQMPAWQVEVDPIGEPVAVPLTPQAMPPPPSASAQAGAPERSPSTPPPLIRILEAILFVGGPPLTLIRAAEVIRGLDEPHFHEAIEMLNRTYRTQGRPYHIQLQDHGYVLTLRPRFEVVRQKLFGGVREARLSQAAVDVLSLVAYRQPATRQEIDSLRGADSGALLRQLIRHGLVALQRDESAGRDIRYVTTSRFLELFGLSSLEDLPQTQDLQRL